MEHPFSKLVLRSTRTPFHGLVDWQAKGWSKICHLTTRLATILPEAESAAGTTASGETIDLSR